MLEYPRAHSTRVGLPVTLLLLSIAVALEGTFIPHERGPPQIPSSAFRSRAGGAVILSANVRERDLPKKERRVFVTCSSSRSNREQHHWAFADCIMLPELANLLHQPVIAETPG